MSEVYRNSTNKAVTFPISGATLTKVDFTRDDTVYDGGTLSPAQIPYAITHVDGEFEVVWTYTVNGDEYTFREEHDVVTPLFTAQELKDFNDQFNSLSDPKIIELERMCRNIIEAYTGQEFGYERDIVKVWGSGERTLLFPKRIVQVNSVSVNGAPFGFYPYTYNPIKSGYGIEQEVAYGGDVFTTVGPINDPSVGPWSIFRDNVSYYVDGYFGWVSPPSDIKQAALLLAELFSCKEATWRDRYIKAITAADWRFDFHDKAFTGTGSRAVDMILLEYRVNNMAII